MTWNGTEETKLNTTEASNRETKWFSKPTHKKNKKDDEPKQIRKNEIQTSTNMRI